MSEAPDVYRRLQQHLDRMPVAFPATASGVELRLLRRLFTTEEAEVALLLSMLPEPLDRLHARDRASGRTREDLERILERLVEKGAVLGSRKRPARRYSKAQLAIGIYELQVDRLTKELEQDFLEYSKEAFAEALLAVRTKQMRTVPVNASFVAERRVGRYDDARALIGESAGPFAVMNCVCRQGKDLLGEPCRQTRVRQTCLTIGSFARSTVARGTAEKITRQGALALLAQAEREGMVLQPSNSEKAVFICFCCGCCCGLLLAAKNFPRPAEYVHSNHHAVISAELCSDCGACRPRCPMDALGCGEQGVAVDLDRCIGCGACVTGCPGGALRLVPKPEQQRPPRSQDALYLRILRERYGVLGAASMLVRTLIGRRV